MKLKNLIFIWLALFSLQAQAENYQYHADVKGMVCAFCAYSVSKNISKLEGVQEDSVNVDLKGGHVDFISSKPVVENKLAELFKESGFSISNLSYKKITADNTVEEKEVSLALEIDAFKIDQFSGVLEAIGNKAANNSASIIIDAPAVQEDTILKPILMGRQQVIKLRFNAIEKQKMYLQLLD